MNDAPPPRLNVESHALFLDFDGTLVDIADDPQAVVAAPGLGSLLSAASKMFGGALALVTGRPLMFVDQRLGWAAPFGAGIHGLEMRGAPAPSLGAGACEPLDRLRAHLREEAQGLLVEDKGIAIALHYRARPELADYALKVAEKWINTSRGTLM